MMGDDTRAESNAFDDMFAVVRADDPLTLFDAEPASIGTEVQGPAPPPPKPQTLPLDFVLERLHYVSWAEGVSIVDALCDELTAVAGTVGRAPELSQVSITSHGTVVVASGAAKGPAGPRLARILHSLTSNGPVPAPLRLFVSKWVAFEETHTIADFSKELAYFVRPERAALIQAVYERASAAAPASPPQTAPHPAAAAPPRKDALRVDSRRRTRQLAAAGIIVAVSAASALAWGALSQSSTSTAPASVSAFAGVPSLLASAATGTRQLAAVVRDRIGIAGSSGSVSAGTQATDRTSEAAPSAATAVASTRSLNRAAARRVPAGAPRPTSAPVTEPPSPSTLAAAVPSSTPPSVGDASSSPAVAPSARRADGRESPIYSSADADVTPPEMQHPQLPPPLLSGVQVDVNTIELIVTEAGTVERVRLLSTPRRMSDMMLLSGAKTWRFEPALRDGRSVRYRLLLSWDATP